MPELTILKEEYMSPAKLSPEPQSIDEIAEEKQLKRLNTKTNGFAAGSSIINSGLFVQNVTQLKIILGRRRRCVNFCEPGTLTAVECDERIRNATQGSSIFRDFDCDFVRMKMITVRFIFFGRKVRFQATIIVSIILQIIYGLVVIIG